MIFGRASIDATIFLFVARKHLSADLTDKEKTKVEPSQMIGWRRSDRRKSTNARKLFSLRLSVLVGGMFYAVFLAPNFACHEHLPQSEQVFSFRHRNWELVWKFNCLGSLKRDLNLVIVNHRVLLLLSQSPVMRILGGRSVEKRLKIELDWLLNRAAEVLHKAVRRKLDISGYFYSFPRTITRLNLIISFHKSGLKKLDHVRSNLANFRITTERRRFCL